MKECGTRLIENVKANERDSTIYKDAAEIPIAIAMPHSVLDLFMVIFPMSVFEPFLQVPRPLATILLQPLAQTKISTPAVISHDLVGK